MAEVLAKWPGRETRSKYERYLDGQVWKVNLSDHPSNHSAASIQAAIRHVANRRGVKIQTAGIKPGVSYFFVRVVGKKEAQ